MTDEIDRMTEITLMETEGLIRAAKAHSDIPVGTPGICRECDCHSQRLVNGRCAPCRDSQ